MSALSDAHAAYETNKSYERMRSVSMAWLFVEACKTILASTESTRRDGQGEARMNLSVVRELHDDARQWIKANDSSASSVPNTSAVIYGDLSQR